MLNDEEAEIVRDPVVEVPDKAAFKITVPEGQEFKLDIGCGQNKQAGHIGIDICACDGVDHVMDVRQTPWPIEDGVVDEIFTSHFFEHLDGPERVDFMHECWRVMKVGARMLIIVPYWASMRSVQDPYHKWPPVCEASFYYFVEHWRQDNKLTHYPIKCNFNFGWNYAADPELGLRAEEVQKQAVRNFLNVVYDLHVYLTKVALGKRE